MLNLQCSSGNDALSLATMGAEVVGVDISTGAIRIAREQAAAAGLTADFLAHDVYQLPDRLQDSSFDLVYSTAGIICWLPDLDRWARIVAAALRPGGRLLLDEHHPVWETATVRPDGGVDLHPGLLLPAPSGRRVDRRSGQGRACRRRTAGDGHGDLPLAAGRCRDRAGRRRVAAGQPAGAPRAGRCISPSSTHRPTGSAGPPRCCPRRTCW